MAADGYDIVDGAVTGEIKIVFSDLAHLKPVLEIASSIGEGHGPVHFTSTGIKINETNLHDDISIFFTIKRMGFPSYRIPQHGEDIPYTVYIKFKDLYEILKTVGTKESCTIDCPVLKMGESYVINDIIIIGTKGNMDKLSCIKAQSFIPYIENPYTDLLNCEPQAKMTLGTFAANMKTFKARKCNILSFELKQNGIVIWGLLDSEKMTTCKIEQEESEWETAGSCPKPEIASEDFAIDIDFGRNNSWLNKIGKLSGATSVMSIYMTEGKPLIFIVPIGFNLGYATFVFIGDA